MASDPFVNDADGSWIESRFSGRLGPQDLSTIVDQWRSAARTKARREAPLHIVADFSDANLSGSTGALVEASRSLQHLLLEFPALAVVCVASEGLTLGLLRMWQSHTGLEPHRVRVVGSRARAEEIVELGRPAHSGELHG